ncbi:MAG: sugar phosphate isomerase/epimerase [Desulfohalobiaceae bacterium]|nr:sugar phosphate isomerase/epimerase [Desulfohalobiaceae bacterium]
MGRYFVNLPCRYIAEDRSYLEYFQWKKINPELGLDPIAVDKLEEDWHRRLADALHKEGLLCSVHLPFHDLQPGSIDEYILQSTRDRLKKAIRIAAIYEPRFLVAHANFIPLYSDLYSSWLKRAMRTWEEVLVEWPDHPALYLENVREYDPGPLADLMAELQQHRVRFCFDLGHWASYSGGVQYNNLGLWMQTLGQYLVHLHLHDNDGVADQHLGLGQGNIPWAEVFSGLELLDLSPTLTLEPHTKEDLFSSWQFMKEHPSWFSRLRIRKQEIPTPDTEQSYESRDLHDTG